MTHEPTPCTCGYSRRCFLAYNNAQKLPNCISVQVLSMQDSQSDEAHKVELLQARLQEKHPDAKGIDGGTLRRFLRARSHNVDAALKFLLQYLEWTQTFKPLGSIQESDIRNELMKEMIFFQGVDKIGCLIGVVLAARHSVADRDLEEFKRFIVFALDKAMASLSGDQEKIVLIADMEGFDHKSLDVKGFLSGLEIFQNNYPERLEKLYILHAHSLFWVGWRILYPFIDANVRKKIVFVDDKQLAETLSEDIDITQLPAKYGGMLPLVPVHQLGSNARAAPTLSSQC